MKKRYVLSWILSIALIAYILYSADLVKVAQTISRIDMRIWLLVCGVYLFGFVFRAIRSQWIVRPISKLGFLESFHLVNIGFLANNILPARLGEFVRAYALAKRKAIGKLQALSTILVERLLDGIILLAGFAIAVVWTASKAVQSYSIYLIIPVILFALAMLFLAFPEKFYKLFFPLLKKFPFKERKIRKRFNDIVAGGKVFRTGWKENAKVWASSALVWAIEVALFGGMCYVLGIYLTLPEALLLATFVGLSTLIPSAPGFLGTYEAAFVIVLTGLGFPADQAVAAAFVTHFSQYIIIAVLGMLALHGLGLNFKNLSESEGKK
ncbi:MAG: lysylphosphatidylglycerol synthase transmembrane domain-containing protein [Candidatus Diapherotrites archaeon]